jgi:uncharacterized coiled-coil DUF342 family protein
MRYKSLEDYISTLSESDKELYRHLIEEARARDVEIRKNCDESRKKLDAWISHMQKHAEAIVILAKSLNELEKSLSDLKTTIQSHKEDVSRDGNREQLLPPNYPISLN